LAGQQAKVLVHVERSFLVYVAAQPDVALGLIVIQQFERHYLHSLVHLLRGVIGLPIDGFSQIRHDISG
jgi:hypothetical protein